VLVVARTDETTRNDESTRPRATRRYDASHRRKQAESTRVGIVRAASELFVEKGWTGASMREIAKRAGVSVETVYASVGNKTELLKVALDIGVAGDDEPIPLGERPEFLAIGTAPDVEGATAAAGHLLAGFYPRVAMLRRVLVQAAMADPDVVELREAEEGRERASWAEGIGLALGRPATDDEVATCAAMFGTETYLVLTQVSGWSDERFGDWLGRALHDHLTDRRPDQ